MASPVVYYSGRATFGMPFGIGSVVRVPFRIGSMVRKPRAATLIRCKRGSFALMTHFGTWLLLEIGL